MAAPMLATMAPDYILASHVAAEKSPSFVIPAE